MFWKKKKPVNEDVLRQMDGREIKYVTKRYRDESGEIKELILGKAGRIVVIENEIRIMCGTEDVMRCDAETSEYGLLLSGDGISVAGFNKITGENEKMIVYYKYHRKYLFSCSFSKTT